MSSLQICVSLFFFYHCISIEGSVFHRGSDFLAMIKTDAFIDKTMLIKQICKEGSRILITAPRKFGKSTNLNMLKTFLSIKSCKNHIIKETFMKLNIHKRATSFFNEHYGKYPVVHVNFKARRTNSYKEALNVYKCAIHEAYLEHEDLQLSKRLPTNNKKLCRDWCGEKSFLKMKEQDVMFGLNSLVRMVREDSGLNKKIILLIDGYDNVINNALFNVHDNSEYDNVVGLTSHILLTLIKDSKADIQLVVISGISYIPSMGLSEVSNLERYYFLDDHPFVKFYGLTENEIASLYIKADFIQHSKKLEVAKELYNGYTCKQGTHIYNTYSFLKFLETGKTIIHWDTSGYFSRVIEMIKYKEIADIFDSLLNYETVYINVQYKINMRQVRNLRSVYLNGNLTIYPDKDILFSHLLELGLLTYATNSNYTYRFGDRCKVKIPNTEVHGIILNNVKQYFNEKCNLPIFLSVGYFGFKIDLYEIYNSIKGPCKLIIEPFIKTIDKEMEASMNKLIDDSLSYLKKKRSYKKNENR